MTRGRFYKPFPAMLRGGAILLLPLLLSCRSDAARIAGLERRVDSLAVTLTAVTNRLNGSPAAARFDSATVTIPGAIVEGQSNAPITIVEYTDFQCPFCGRHARTTLPQLRQKYIATGQVRYIIRDLPLSIHPNAPLAAAASLCAAEQGAEKYWAFHDTMFAHQAGMTRDTVLRAGKLAGLDQGRLEACAKSPRITAEVAADLAVAEKAGFTGTPTFVIARTTPSDTVRGISFTGALTISVFDEQIRRASAGAP